MYWQPRTPKPDTSRFIPGTTLADTHEYVTDPGYYWHWGEGNTLWTRHPESLRTFERHASGFISYDAQGYADREIYPAGVSHVRIAWYSHGKLHRDPEIGPASIEYDGHVIYAVDGEEVEPSAEILEAQGVLWLVQGLLMKPSLRYQFDRMRSAYIAQTFPDPWAC